MNGMHDLISCIHLDSISVDTVNNTVTVGAGATVREVLKALKAHGLTLENFSSIQEQQMAGWTQVAAHGTGISLPTVEEQVVQMKIVSPSEGLITVSRESNPKLFSMVKVGLGSLGVVTEMTLKCIPRHNLIMESNHKTFQSISDGHIDRLRKYRHVRYMWIPFADAVISVQTDVHKQTEEAKSRDKPAVTSNKSNELATAPLINLLLELQGRQDNKAILEKMSFAQLRDLLLAFAPLDLQVRIQYCFLRRFVKHRSLLLMIACI
jgi:L-galactono-1,4-lactone dehydrogenase